MNAYFDNDNQFQQKDITKFQSKGMTGLIMKLSFVRTNKQANMILLSIAAVFFVVSIFYFSNFFKEAEGMISKEEILKNMHIEQ